jgi:excisionase family DNA binding protein
MEQELWSAAQVTRYLGVTPLTVYRWCRQGRLPALKIGKTWRIRHAVLEDFLRGSERGQSLSARLGAFLTVPDHVIGIAASLPLVYRVDAAFFQVAEARGGLLVKLYAPATGALGELRAALTREGLDVVGLEVTGRLHFVAEAEGAPPTDRVALLRGLPVQAQAEGRALWVCVDWATGRALDGALRQQEAIAELGAAGPLVAKVTLREEDMEAWPLAEQRRIQHLHHGVIWIADTGLVLSRASPLPRT